MTGKIVIEFEGAGIPDIKIVGEVNHHNFRVLNRFLSKAYKAYRHNYGKEKARQRAEELAELTPAVEVSPVEIFAPVTEVFEVPEPMPAADPMLHNLFEEELEEDTSLVDEETSEDKDVEDDEERTTGDVEGSGSESGSKETE